MLRGLLAYQPNGAVLDFWGETTSSWHRLRSLTGWSLRESRVDSICSSDNFERFIDPSLSWSGTVGANLLYFWPVVLFRGQVIPAATSTIPRCISILGHLRRTGSESQPESDLSLSKADRVGTDGPNGPSLHRRY